MAEKTKKEETKSVTPWRPFTGLTGWERDMDRMMEDFFGRRARPWWPERWSRTEEMDVKPPIVDVFEEKDDIVVKAELPGHRKRQNRGQSDGSHSDHQRREEKRRKRSKRKTIIAPSVRTGAFCGH